MPEAPRETPKDVLLKQAEIPRIATEGSPVAPLGEGVSGILSSIAQTLPDVAPAALPELPQFPPPPAAPRQPQFMRGAEEASPRQPEIQVQPIAHRLRGEV